MYLGDVPIFCHAIACASYIIAQKVGCTARCAELSFAYGDVTRGPGSDPRSETRDRRFGSPETRMVHWKEEND